LKERGSAMRVNITLEHKNSGERLYLTSKNKRNNPERLELRKYSKKLRKHVIFKEVK
jgi:large subunit ribosomal protein L33